MPLNRKSGPSAPKELGLFWSMQTTEGADVDVFVYASALQHIDRDPVGPVGLLKRHRSMLEKVASAKYDRRGLTENDLVHITEQDLRAAHAETKPGVDI